MTLPNDEIRAKNEEIFNLISQFKEKTGLKFVKMADRMTEILGYDYDIRKFENFWRRVDSIQRNYPIEEVFALIEALVNDIPLERRIALYDAFTLFGLTGVSMRSWIRLKSIFEFNRPNFANEYNRTLNQWLLDHDVAIQQHPLASYIQDFNDYIIEKSKDFVGRDWLFKRVRNFIEDDRQTSGYIIITGQPGIGKSSVASRLVWNYSCPHHFNSRWLNMTRQEDLWSNLCAQLIERFKLAYTEFPPHYNSNNRFFVQLLEEVSKQIANDDEPCVIVIDALDEAENVVLPHTLPDHVYIILSERPSIQHSFTCPVEIINIDPDSSDNRNDVDAFIKKKTRLDAVQKYMHKQSIDTHTFILDLSDKSEGNFVFLYYIFFEIQEDIYHDRAFKDIPTGLHAYYEDQWLRMEGKDRVVWYQYKHPVLLVLAVVYEPIPIELILHFTEIKRPAIVRDVLREWRAFLYEKPKKLPSGKFMKLYRLYHESFFDFLKEKDEIAESQHITLDDMNKQIADIMWNDIGGDEAFGLDES